MLEFPTFDHLYTAEQLQEVDTASLDAAKKLVQQELKGMKLHKLHPIVAQEYGDNDTLEGPLAEMEKQYHEQIYGDEDLDVAKLSAVNLSRYTAFQTQNKEVDFRQLYTTYGYENNRINSLSIASEVKHKLKLSPGKRRSEQPGFDLKRPRG